MWTMAMVRRECCNHFVDTKAARNSWKKAVQYWSIWSVSLELHSKNFNSCRRFGHIDRE